SALCTAAIHAGHRVHGLGRSIIAGLPAGQQTRCSIVDRRALERAIMDVAPDAIIHAAALTSDRHGPENLATTNVTGTLNLFESARQLGSSPTVVLVSSSAVYGAPDDRIGEIDEDTPFAPVTYYAYTKVCQEMLAHLYFDRHGVHTIRVRPFNVVGPGQ